MNSINAENYNLILDKKYKKLITLKNNIMGYPENQNFSYANLNKFYDLSLNNVGDSFIPSNYPLNSHEFEADVIRYIANLYNKYQNYWGYITNGGTEGNLVALHVARKMYPEGIVYYSEQSHYSILKAIEVTRSNSICIPVLKNGEINYELFAHRISENKNLPAIIMLNLGTTMTGAIDDIEKIKYVLHHYKIKKHYLHCDAALHGLILPFCSLNKPIILDDFHSISISGHKFIGSPLPCGVFVTHQKYINRIKRNVDYIKSSDCTLTGSRNGISALILWSAIKQNSTEKFKEIANHCLATAEYAKIKMNELGIKAWLNEYSPIVVFPRPNNRVIKKWSLAPFNNMAHIVTMPHINSEMIDLLIKDIVGKK